MEKDNVNHPVHYNSSNIKCFHCKKEIECIDVVRRFDFNLGNAIKYIWRSSHKGNQIEDIKKAIWYLDDFIKNKVDQVSILLEE